MRYYLAGPYAARDLLRETVERWDEQPELECTSHWLHGSRAISTGTTGASAETPADQVREFARGDLTNVQQANVMVAVNLSALPSIDASLKPGSGGRHVELGFALGRGKRCLIVGEPENVFQRGLATSIVESLEDALPILLDWRGLYRPGWEGATL